MRDVAVIGGGVIGLMSAWRLAQQGLKVALYEQDVCGAGASGHAIGGLIPFSYSRNHNMAQAQRASLDLYPALVEELQQETRTDVGYLPCGRLQVFATQGQRDSAEKDAAASNGVQRVLSTQEALAVEPAASVGALGALYCSKTARLAPVQLLYALMKACEQRAVQIHQHVEVVDLDKVKAKQVLVTAGAWSSKLVPQHMVKPVKGQALRLKLDKPCFTHMVRQGEVYLVPYEDGSVLVGSTAEKDSGFDTTPTAAAKEKLWNTAVKIIPALADAKLEDHWAGLRPFAEENWPLVKRIDERVLVAAGHYKIGLCLAPVVAEEVVTFFR